MVRFDAKRINQFSPYFVEEEDIVGSFSFSTDFGVIYNVSFIDDDLVTSDDSYQLIVANANHVKSPRDPKLKDTILAIVSEFFECNNCTVLYICETGDGKQRSRSRLFEYWFKSYHKSHDYTFLQTELRDMEGVTNYVAVISRNDNPNLKNVFNEFAETITTLRQKPV